MATHAELRALCDRHMARGQLSVSLQWARRLTDDERETGQVEIAPGLVSRYATPHFERAILTVDVADLNSWLLEQGYPARDGEGRGGAS